MRIKFHNIIGLALIIAGVVIVVRILPAIVRMVNHLSDRLADSSRGHSESLSAEALTVILVGFALITALAALKLLLRHRRDSHQSPESRIYFIEDHPRKYFRNNNKW